MEKLFLVCIDCIVYGILESGKEIFSSFEHGLLGESYEKQKEFVKESFKTALGNYGNKYDIVFVIVSENKKDLKEAINKIIANNKKDFSNDDWEVWEKYLLKIENPDFDKYNKEVLNIK